ncbi:MAG: O-antigen ligase family protein, partial [Schleiferiaceae bacterium]|nr:O-antigen ligase family protein [Schleiferiaceae bacterium]
MIKKITPQITVSILIVLLGFVHSNQTIDPAMIPRHTAAAFITAGFLFFLFFKKWGLKSLAFLRSRWALPFYVFIGGSILSIISTNTPSEAYFSIGQSIFVFALVVFFIDLIQSKKEHFFTLLKGFVILGLFFFLIGLYEYFQLNSDTEIYEVKSWLAHRNLFASIALFFGILSFAGYFFFKNLWKVISLANTFCSLFFVFSLGSRSAQLGLISVITLNLAIYFFNRVKLNISFKRIKQGVLVIGASVLLILSVLFVFHKIQPIDQAGVGKRFFAQDQKMYTIKERSLLWEKTAYMWLDASITGVGAGNWKIEFPKYGSGIWRARQGLVQFQRPHNDFLWVLSETGILGFAGYI